MGAAFHSRADRQKPPADPESHTPILSILPCRDAEGLPLLVTIPTRDNDAGTPCPPASSWSQPSPLPRTCTSYAKTTSLTCSGRTDKASARTALSRAQERTFHLKSA